MNEELSVQMEYNYIYVALSVIVAFVTSYTCFYAIHNLLQRKWIWYTFGGTVMGLGIWTTHYVGMMAVNIPLIVTYDLYLTLLSIIPAVLGVTVSLYFANSDVVGSGRLSLSALFMGGGISFMHYLGMSAMKLNAYVYYDPVVLMISFFISVFLSTFALNLSTSILQKRLSLSSIALFKNSLLMSCAIGAMHYSGMGAVSIYSSADVMFDMSDVASNAQFHLDTEQGLISAGMVTIMLLAIMVIIIYANRMKEIYSARNRELDELMKKNSKYLAEAVEENEHQMHRLAAANVRMTLINEAANNLKQADKLFHEYGNSKQFYSFIVKNIMEATDAKYGAILLLDAQGKVSKMIAPEIDSATESLIGRTPMCKGIFDINSAEDVAVSYKNVREEKKHRGFPSGHPEITSLLLQPLKIEGNAMGMILLANKSREDGFSKDDEMMMAFYANEVVQTLHKNQLMAKLRRNNRALSKEKKEQQDLINTLRKTKEQLLQSEKMASIGQLAAGVAHEINNPVGYINSNIRSLSQYVNDLFYMLDIYEGNEHLLMDYDTAVKTIKAAKNEIDLEFLKKDIVSLVNESLEGVTRVKQIVQDLKDFSHVDEAEWQWSDLHKNIDSTLNIVNNEIKYKARVEKNYGDLPQVECFVSQINQVFMNLLVNAAHAIEDDGVITITTGSTDGDVWIEIADTGKGISQEDMGRIFDPFFTTKPVGQGTGLGLALSYGIVKKHRGELKVESKVGEGTRFTVVLPISQSEQKIAV